MKVNLPNAGEPMSNEGECSHEQKEDCRSIFRIAINLE